jgi:enoyl-CoA hydratase/carnithine racemase
MQDSRNPLIIDVRDGVGILTLNRPEVHNAVSDALRAALSDALKEVESRGDVRAVLLRGEGKSFCSGRDTRELGHRVEGVTHEDYIRNSQRIRRQQIELPKPLVCALKGYVVGGGAEMALAADLRIAADNLRFRLPEVLYGLALDTGGSAMLCDLIGPARAKWLMMSGEAIGAEEALAWGLVEWVVAPGDLDARAFEIARKLAALPPEAVSAQKALIAAITSKGVAGAMEREVEVQSRLFRGAEYQQLKEARGRNG